MNENTQVSIADLPVVLTVEEVAPLLRLSRLSAYAAVRSGQIPSIRVGRRILIPRAKLAEMLGEQLSEAA